MHIVLMRMSIPGCTITSFALKHNLHTWLSIDCYELHILVGWQSRDHCKKYFNIFESFIISWPNHYSSIIDTPVGGILFIEHKPASMLCLILQGGYDLFANTTINLNIAISKWLDPIR